MPALTVAVGILCCSMPIVSVIAAGVLVKNPRLQYKYMSPLEFNTDAQEKIESLRARLNANMISAYFKEGRVFFSDGSVLNVRYKGYAYGYLESWRGSKMESFLLKRGSWETHLACEEIEKLAKESSAITSDNSIDLLADAFNKSTEESSPEPSSDVVEGKL